jgi:hypothetical protein
MGPTYFGFQIYELIKLAKTFGLSNEDVKCGISRMIAGTADIIFNSDLIPEKILDLVPVRPFEQEENTIREIYNTSLTSIYNRLTKASV